MEAVLLEAKIRDNFGKGPSKKYRKEGFIPSTIYGQGSNINILIKKNVFNKLSHKITKSTVINLKLNDKTYDVLIKDYHKDYLKDDFYHIDFYELKTGKLVHFKIPLNFIGNAVGIKEGGMLEKHLVELEVECLPKDIIASYDINIENMKINDTLHVSDLNLDSKYKILSHQDEVIAHITGKKEEEIEEEAVAAEVEVEEKAEEVKKEE